MSANNHTSKCSIVPRLHSLFCPVVLTVLLVLAAVSPSQADPATDIQVAGRNFIDGNGQRFLWMGDTSWLFSTSELPCAVVSNQTRCDVSSNFKTYIDERANQGFNVLQGNIYALPQGAKPGRPAAEGITETNEGGQSPFCDTGNTCDPQGTRNCGTVRLDHWDYGCPNDAYYNNVKSRISYMNSKGIIAEIAPSWGAVISCNPVQPDNYPYAAPGWTQSQISNYYSYVANFFKDQNIVWLVASNTSSPGPPGCSSLTWTALRNTIYNKDKSHLITMHPQSGASPPWGNFSQLQNQPCIDPTVTTNAPVPVVNGEFNYEVTQTCWDDKCSNAHRQGDACVQSGSDYVCNDSRFNRLDSNGLFYCLTSIDSTSCDANCENEHHSGPDVVLHGAWSNVMRGGYFDYGNAATYNQFLDKSGCFSSTYYDSAGATEMTLLSNFFNNNDPNHPELRVRWDDAAFGPINPPNITGCDDKLVMGEVGTQYVLYAAQSSGNFSDAGTDPGPWEYREYNIRTGTWNPPLSSCANTSTNNISHISISGADKVILANKFSGIVCDPTVTVTPGENGTLNCSLTAVGNFYGDIDFSCPGAPAGVTCTGPPNANLGPLDCQKPFVVTVQAATGVAKAGIYSVNIHAHASHGDAYDSNDVLLTVRGIACDSFNGPNDPIGSTLDVVPQTSEHFVWSWINDSSVQGTGKKGTVKPKMDGTSPSVITPCINCSLDADVQITQPGKIYLLGWYSDIYNRVEMMLKYSVDGQKLQLKQMVNGVKAMKKSKPASITLGTWYHMQLSYDGANFDAKLTGPCPDSFCNSTSIVAEINKAAANNTTIPLALPALRVAKSTGIFSNLGVCYDCTPSYTSECSGTFQPLMVSHILEGGDEFTQPPGMPNQPLLSVEDLDIDEDIGGTQEALVRVTIDPPSHVPLTLHYSTSDGTAVDGRDYLMTAGYADIDAGQTVKVLRIPIIPGSVVGQDQNFNVDLNEASAPATITRSHATVTIHADTEEDDDGIDDEYDMDCPAEFSVVRNDSRMMTCGITRYDFVNLDTDVAWSCQNAGSVVCSSFSSNGEDQLYVQMAPGSTAAGDIPNFTVQGTVGPDTRTDMLNLHVVDFQPTCPATILVNRGEYTDSSCSVGYSSNWTDTTLQVSWTCSGLPTGVTCSFTPNPWTVSSGANVTLHIQADSSAQGGNYNITVTGTSGSQARPISVQLQVITQQTYTFYPVGDTYLTGYSQQNTNYGLATNLRMQQTPNYSHAVLKVSQQDLLNTIGTHQILSANLRLYIETNFHNWPQQGAAVEVHRMTGSWAEYASSIPPQGATWNCAIDTNVNNANPDCFMQWNGGSYSSPVLSSVLHTNNLTGWITFDVKSDVQAIQGGSSHYGWLIRKQSWGSTGSVDYTSIQGNPVRIPRLEVTIQY